jgi:hypothetical protein
MTSQQSPVSIEYEMAGRPLRAWTWMVPLLFGLAQFPWFFAVSLWTLDWQLLKPVSLRRDSLLFLLAVALTIPAILSSAYGAWAAYSSRRARAAVLCAAILAVSLLLLSAAAQDWYQEVYMGRGQSWGQW